VTATVAPRLASVFGSSRLGEGEAEYEQARELGRRLVLAGWTPCTGGYQGTMEAVCRGAAEAGGRPVGVTVAAWDWLSPNRWVAERREAADLYERLRALIAVDAMIAVGGGVGTLAEVALAWNLGQRRPEDRRPLIVVGARCRGLLDAFAAHLIDGPRDLDLIVPVDDVDGALAALGSAA
jgi:uncharacterized protein (TIGR00730 family)